MGVRREAAPGQAGRATSSPLQPPFSTVPQTPVCVGRERCRVAADLWPFMWGAFPDDNRNQWGPWQMTRRHRTVWPSAASPCTPFGLPLSPLSSHCRRPLHTFLLLITLLKLGDKAFALEELQRATSDRLNLSLRLGKNSHFVEHHLQLTYYGSQLISSC